MLTFHTTEGQRQGATRAIPALASVQHNVHVYERQSYQMAGNAPVLLSKRLGICCSGGSLQSVIFKKINYAFHFPTEGYVPLIKFRSGAALLEEVHHTTVSEINTPNILGIAAILK